MGMGQQKSAPLRRKVQCKSFLPGTFWCAGKMWTAGVHPCAVPRGGDAFSGSAVPWPGVAMGQAVPKGECLRGGEQGHGSATAAKAMSLRCAKSPPFEFCIQHIGRHGMTFLKGFPRCPYGVVGPFFELTGWARPALWGTQHPFEGMGFPERVNPPLSRTLPIVVARGVQRDVGVRQIMSQIRRCPRNGLWVGHGAVGG